MPQHAVSKLAYLVLSSARSCRSSVCPGRLSTLGWSRLPSFLVIWSPRCDMQGPSVVFEAVDMLFRRPFHFYHRVHYIYDFCPLPDPHVGPSIFVCDVEHTSFHFGLCGRNLSLFCACLVSVQVSAPYVIAGSTHELNTCLVRQMAKLLLKISRCLAYAAQPAMILEDVTLPEVYIAFNIFYQHIVNVYLAVIYSHHIYLCDVHLKTHSPTFIG